MAPTVSEKKKTADFDYKSEEYQSLLESLQSEKQAIGLLSFIGPYMPDKKKAIMALADVTGLQIRHRSFKNIVHKSNQLTRDNIDEAFQDVNPKQHLMFFTNGANLCGNYMGNTFSKVKYATPEEKHFLNHVDNFGGLTVVTVRSDDAADETIKRKSRSIVRFPLPSSSLKRFAWKLRNYTFHGFKLPDERIEIT